MLGKRFVVIDLGVSRRCFLMRFLKFMLFLKINWFELVSEELYGLVVFLG